YIHGQPDQNENGHIGKHDGHKLCGHDTLEPDKESTVIGYDGKKQVVQGDKNAAIPDDHLKNRSIYLLYHLAAPFVFIPAMDTSVSIINLRLLMMIFHTVLNNYSQNTSIKNIHLEQKRRHWPPCQDPLPKDSSPRGDRGLY
ncbi:hypothetical protein LCGC14_2337090, partial [marine sediment metagenome]